MYVPRATNQRRKTRALVLRKAAILLRNQIVVASKTRAVLV